jgi:aryl-alcohol dehydrogenase-like predicted oxidoreductase
MNNLSKIGVGALHFGSFTSKKNAIKLIDKCYDNGINWIDTSPIYGNGLSESIISSSSHYKKMLIATKFGLEVNIQNNNFNVRIAKMTTDYIQNSLQKSLRNLNINEIDLYQLHAYDTQTPINEILFTLQKFVKKGYIKNVGLLNLNPKELSTVIDFKIKENFKEINSIQVQYNMIERRFEKDIIKISKNNNLHIIANRVLCSGILSGKYKDLNNYPKSSRAFKSARIRTKISHEIINVLKKIDELNFSNLEISQIPIIWVLQSEFIDSLVLGIRNEKHLNLMIDTLHNEYDYIFDRINEVVKQYYPLDVFNYPLKYME